MRAGGWSTFRDISAAKTNWVQAREIADQLPAEDPNRLAMQIAPRTLLCGTPPASAAPSKTPDSTTCTTCAPPQAGDKVSLAIGMIGLLTALTFNDRITEAARWATECTALIDRRPHPDRRAASRCLRVKYEAGEVIESLRLCNA